MKKQLNFILRYLSLKILNDQIIKPCGAIYLVFFFCWSLVNVCKKANKLIRKKQRTAQSSMEC